MRSIVAMVSQNKSLAHHHKCAATLSILISPRKCEFDEVLGFDLLWPSLACCWRRVNHHTALFSTLMSKPFFIGIDGGATSCRARIRDMDGSLLGEGESGPANIHSNFRLAMQSIRLACEAALRSAALDEKTLQHSHAGLGLAGAGIKSACDRLLSEKMPFASMVLETDAYAAWLGAHQGGDGAIVILGTGSCGLALINGRRIGVAGWGAEVSDEAGGQRMGREALRRTLWAFDGRAEKTALSTAILDRFGRGPGQDRPFCIKSDTCSLC